MKSPSRLLLLCAVPALALILTACSPSARTLADTATEPAVSKEAGALGSRICFLNDTTDPMSAAPGGRVNEENGSSFVGTAGPLSADAELCFAGWNSREAYDLQPRMFGVTHWGYEVVDVMVSVSADGNYNALSFYADNPSIRSTKLQWKVDPEAKQNWKGQVFSVDESTTVSAGGLNFTVARRGDSQNYKEYVVRFTR